MFGSELLLILEQTLSLNTTDSIFDRYRSSHRWDIWQPGMAIVDFSNPKASEWFSSKLEKLLEMGVDSLKTDFGERIPHLGVKFHDGSTGR